jgi:anti-sigma B factor antagonist
VAGAYAIMIEERAMASVHYSDSLTKRFEIRAEEDAGTTFLRLSGEFDLSCEERFEHVLEGLRARPPDRLVLDLRGLNFIDSSGMRLILAAHSLQNEDGFDFSVIPGEGQVRRVCAVTGLDRVLPVFEP